MTPDRLAQIEQLFYAAHERPAERAALLALADPGVRREVESLLNQSALGLLDSQALVAPLVESASFRSTLPVF